MTLAEAYEIGAEARKLLDDEFAKTGIEGGEGSTCNAVARVLANRAALAAKVVAVAPARPSPEISKQVWEFLARRASAG